MAPDSNTKVKMRDSLGYVGLKYGCLRLKWVSWTEGSTLGSVEKLTSFLDES